MSDARSKVESWVKGFASSVRADTTASEGMEDFTLKKTRKKKKEDHRDVVSRLVEAMDPCSMGGRKPKSMKHWRRLACQHLGITKMGAKRWEAIVACGVEHDMFHVEQCGSGRSAYETLVLNEEPFDEEEVEHIATTVFGCPTEEDDDEGPPELSDGPLGPTTLPCGHMGWGSDTEHKEAQEAGKCCANWRSQPEWRIRGLKEPVPVGFRRSKEREGSLGWPGLCCDPETGLYIGGLANDCRHYHTGPERCVVHAGGSPPRGKGKG